MSLFGGSSGSNEREEREKIDAGSRRAESISISPEQASMGLYENALEKCAVRLTLVAVRLERLRKYYDRNFVGSRLAGAYEHYAGVVSPAALQIYTSYSNRDAKNNYYTYARNVDRTLDMPESWGYEKNVDDTVVLIEETLRDLLELHYCAGFVDQVGGFQSELSYLRSCHGALFRLFLVYFYLLSLRMFLTNPGSLTFVPDVTYDIRLTEGWNPIQSREPVRSGPFEYLQPPRFEFDPNLVIIRKSNSEEEHQPFERAVCEGREGVLIPCCSHGEVSYFDSLLEEWVATLGEGGRKTEVDAPQDLGEDDPEIPF